MKKFAYTNVVLTLILVFLGYLIVFYFNPLNLMQLAMERNIVTNAAKLAKVDVNTFQSMAELGKTNGFTDIDVLRKKSSFDGQVYKDAKKGDRAIAFSSKMVIYRNGKLIYEGDSPAQLQAKDQAERVKAVDAKVKAQSLVTTQEVPQVAIVQDKEPLKDNPFYAKAAVGDYVLVYANASVAVLASGTSGEILNSTKLNAQSAQSSSKKN